MKLHEFESALTKMPIKNCSILNIVQLYRVGKEFQFQNSKPFPSQRQRYNEM